MNKNILSEVKKYITVKTVFSIVSVSAIIPLCKALYWVFETSYFGYFGISPEIFSRPLFSSGFISVWLFVTAMYPMFFVWTGLMVVCFLILVSFNYEEPNFERDVIANDVGSVNGEPEEISVRITFWVRLKAAFSNLGESIAKSFAIPFIFWVSGFVALMAVTLLFLWADKEGGKLAKNQVDSYINDHECKDGFNNSNVGCFEISGIDGEDYFVITNSESHLIYMSRNEAPSNSLDADVATPPTSVHIVEKRSDDVFRLKRAYKRDSTENKVAPN